MVSWTMPTLFSRLLNPACISFFFSKSFSMRLFRPLSLFQPSFSRFVSAKPNFISNVIVNAN
jgi:hypothetical protein